MASEDAPPHHALAAWIGPSVLAADLSRLADEVQRMERCGADYIHVDVMDGHFTANLTFGAPVVKCLRPHTTAFLDVHLMVTNPERWVDDMATAGANRFTFHVEVAEDVRPIIESVRARDMLCGLAVKPNTPVASVFPYVELLDVVLVMTVEPGFGGQSFMSDMMPKVRELRRRFPNLNIEVDGGLGPATIDEAAAAGANQIVAGSSVFKGNPPEVISIMRRSIETHGNGRGPAELSPIVTEEQPPPGGA
eukprot:CAMPEP_0198440356 /NCGR_PEP_ID=MMETSP1452-20131203/58508_1 /TAXON_ID=1181717 /ORGANISM="Synchroma pusillum, Strain CCMP3072" /LENGTH=249 /DNA_ID=CAMNT_0044160973 /DNA_START=1 /DNA_END=750 /DNA_ORIENTATION=-